MSNDFDPQEFERRVKEQLAISREAFTGKYKKELNDLAGLSRDEIDTITPGISDLQKFDELIAVVKEASRVNLNQAELIEEIKKLGGIAIAIAKKIPQLSALL